MNENCGDLTTNIVSEVVNRVKHIFHKQKQCYFRTWHKWYVFTLIVPPVLGLLRNVNEDYIYRSSYQWAVLNTDVFYQNW
jgi:hypothetical protein